MLPIPATNRWSMSSSLSRPVRPVRPRPRTAADQPGDSGSGPRWASAAGRPGGAPGPPGGAGATNSSPKVRGSTKRSSRPSDRPSTACVCLANGHSGVVSNSWPDIRRWMTRVSAPSSSGTSRNLPIRPASPSRAPRSRSTSASAGWRRTVRAPVTTTDVTPRPATSRASPRRTTSTSGSSGTVLEGRGGRLGRFGGSQRGGLGLGVAQPLPGHPGGGLLGLLLRPALALAPGRPLEHHVGVEAFGVVGAFVAHLVTGHLVEAAGGQLLEAGLVVLPAGPFGGGGDPLPQQAHHQLVGG